MRKICVVVADGGRARFFTLEREDGGAGQNGPARLREHEDFINPEFKIAGRELFRDVEGGRNRAPSGGSYRTDDHRERHRVEIERRFARLLADRVSSLLERENGWKLVLAAEPSFLGLLRPALRETLPEDVRVVELAENLSRFPAGRIQSELVAHGALPNLAAPSPPVF